MIERAKPMLKWVGGKGQLKDVILKEIDRLHPHPISTYYEPFLGGGAIFFALAAEKRFERAVISDCNAELVAMYRVLQQHPDRLISALDYLVKKGFSEKRYYEVRDSKPRSEAGRAARTIYLNKLGFNGLYRVNKKGQFNVPFGKHKNPKIYDFDALVCAYDALKGVEIRCEDYKVIFKEACKTGGFLYADPPYWPTRPTASFTSYTADDFGRQDQERLAYELERLVFRGVPALLSNSDVPETRKLYGKFRKKKVSARRSVNSDGAKRGAVSELLIESTLRK